MSTITLPTFPVYPGPAATPEELAAYSVAVELYRLAAQAAHAQAQENTAVAMAAGVAAQVELARVMGLPQPAPLASKVDAAVVIAGHLSARPVSVISAAPTSSKIAADAKATVDALALLYPGQFED